jgi:hypothetical protein
LATSPCTVNATATVTVTQQALPNAGTNGTLTVCAGTTQSNLNYLLLEHRQMVPGQMLVFWFTYTVAATSPCTVAATATVTVYETALY